MYIIYSCLETKERFSIKFDCFLMGACDGSLGTRAALSTTHYHRHTRRQPLIPHKKKNTSHNTHADQWLFNAFAASREGVVLDRISVCIIIAIDK